MFKFTKSTKIYCASLLIPLAVFGILQYRASGVTADPDGFYHAKASQLITEGKLGDTFPWLAYTTWKDGYANQHYLYHLALIPFNTVERLPWSMIVFGVLFCGVFLLLMSRLKVAWKVWWLILLLLGSVDFLFRINIVKANTLSLVLMCLSFITLISWRENRQYGKLAALAGISFVFVWTYGGFVFLPMLMATYVFAILVRKRELDILPAVAVGTGILLGLVLHPHSSHLLGSLANQLFQTGLRAGSEVPAGNEWLAYDMQWFIKSDLIILFVWLFSLIIAAINVYKKSICWKTVWFQLNAILLLALALWHRRFIEYFIPYAVIASAVTISPYLARLQWENFKTAIKYWQFKIAIILLVITTAWFFYYNLKETDNALRAGTSVIDYKDASEKIAGDSAPGDVVLSTQWDQFPQQWYWNDKNYYMVGLDPTFMYLHDADKYWAWRKIADDNPEDWSDPSAVHDSIKNQLQAKYVFAEISRNSDIVDFMGSNPDLFEQFYRSETVAVYKVK